MVLPQSSMASPGYGPWKQWWREGLEAWRYCPSVFSRKIDHDSFCYRNQRESESKRTKFLKSPSFIRRDHLIMFTKEEQIILKYLGRLWFKCYFWRKSLTVCFMPVLNECPSYIHLELCGPVQGAIATCGYWALEMWLVHTEMCFKCEMRTRVQRLSKKKDVSSYIEYVLKWYFGHRELNKVYY